jgi:DNA-binding GntR family transcriptional regulator
MNAAETPGDDGPTGLQPTTIVTEGMRLNASVRKRVTAVELVRDVLRAGIIRGDLPGGSQLVQTDIADQLKVSTTPVREAMRDLASEGLITLDSHRIGTVRTPDWDEMVEIVEVRRALERVAIEKAMARITPSQMEDANRLAEELAAEEDLGSWVLKNSAFHSIFHRATGTKRLAGMLLALEEAGGVFVAQAQRLHPELRRQAVADHFAMLDCYRRHDLEGALEVQFTHVALPLATPESSS